MQIRMCVKPAGNLPTHTQQKYTEIKAPNANKSNGTSAATWAVRF